MALALVERVSVRRYAGYGLAPASPDALEAVMDTLTTEQEAVVRTTFLPSLMLMEAGIAGSADTLDTKSAAVWVRNENELSERSALYRGQRLALCRFLGIEPGPGIFDPLLVVPDPGSTEGDVLIPPAIFAVSIAGLLLWLPSFAL